MASTFVQDGNGITIDKGSFEKWKPKFLLKNLEKQKAVRRKMWWAHKMPDEIKCWHEKDGVVRVPMGIVWFLDIPYQNQEPKTHAIPNFQNGIRPYPYQTEAVDSLLKHRTGLLHATTGSGKTIMALELAIRLQVKTLYVVKDKTLLKQTLDYIRDKLGVNPNYYGGTITKAYLKTVNTDSLFLTTIQSAEKVDTSKFGLIILDEVHTMIGSDKRREWVGNINVKYMYWLTGTPIINDVDPRVFNLYVWPPTKCSVVNMIPDYVQIYTTFEYELDDIKEFYKLKSALYEDTERNEKIVRTITDTLGNNKGLVFTDYIEHSILLQQSLQALGIETHLLIGSVHQDERKRITEYVKNATTPQIIVGSVQIIGTGFDLPELSRSYLTTTTRFKWDLLQYIWRIIRKHPTKSHPIFYDFVDINQPLLESQSISRSREYKKEFKGGKLSFLL